MEKLNIIEDIDSHIEESLAVLEQLKIECTSENPEQINEASEIALEFLKKFPVVYGEINFTDAIALRWKQQINENAKSHCYFEAFPELLHNEIEAWHGFQDQIHQNYSVVLLRDAKYEKEIGINLKVEATKMLIIEKGASVIEVWTRGESELARLLSLSYLGDFVSIYLAMAKGVNPTEIFKIKAIKQVEFTGVGDFNGAE
jgi:glucose/mannose-6-phosphate isomerase